MTPRDLPDSNLGTDPSIQFIRTSCARNGIEARRSGQLASSDFRHVEVRVWNATLLLLVSGSGLAGKFDGCSAGGSVGGRFNPHLRWPAASRAGNLPEGRRQPRTAIRPTVLIVDDDPGTSETFAVALRGAGFDAVTAAT